MSEARQVFSTVLCDVLGIEYPVLQSGMGGVAGPALAAEVSNAGGLGIVAGTLTAPDVLRDAIRQVRSLTDRPFGVNLLLLPEVRHPVSTDLLADATVAAVHRTLNPIRELLGLPESEARPPSVPDLVTPALEVIIDERVPVFSAGLGDPGPELTARLHDAGIRTIVMVTNAADARLVAGNGADVVVAQGLEAGGHRSHFTKPASGTLGDLGTLALVPEVVDAVDVPVVAAGGILDGRGLVAALALGASGVLMGSRFLATRESAAPEAHKKRLLEDSGEHTVVTDRLTGRYARVLRNAFTDGSSGTEQDVAETLPFPAQYLANADIFAAAERTENADYLPLWAGQSIGRVNDLPWASDVISDIIRQAADLLERQLAERIHLRLQ
ncbi:MAG: NAD(P)H-dependent flavin oxidoreductase [Candidatus Limnocylindrales bacterium]